MRRSMRLIAVLLVVGAVGFGASAAFGTTGSSTAGNLGFSVTVPDSVAKGQNFTWSGSVTNYSESLASDAMLHINIQGPNGISKNAYYQIHLAPGQTFSRSNTIKVPSFVPSGSYTVTLYVQSPQNGTGQASAQSSIS
jgi:hypothetical protein